MEVLWILVVILMKDIMKMLIGMIGMLELMEQMLEISTMVLLL